MRVYTIQNYNYSRLSKKQKDPIAFKSMLYDPDSFIHRKSPALNLLDNYFKHTISVSRIAWHIPDKELEPYIKVIDIENEKQPHIRMWDINTGKKTKYAIVLHGLNNNITSLQELYKGIFTSTDYAVLAPEYHGFTPNDKKDVCLNPKTILRDVDNAIKYLNAHGIPNENITLIGHSFGCYSASELAKKYPDLEDLILICPVNTKVYFSQKIKESKFKSVPASVKNTITGSVWTKSILDSFFNPNKVLRKVKAPVDIVFASSDKYSNSAATNKTANSCKNLRSINTVDSEHKMSSDKIAKVISILNSNQRLDEQLF